MYGYKIDENESIVFSTKKDYTKAISDLKKQNNFVELLMFTQYKTIKNG